MRYALTTFALLIALKVSAQLSVGSNGITILAGTPFTTDGLTLNPATDLTITNNSIQRLTTPVTGSPNGSINRAYQFSTPISFSGTVGIQYLTSELSGRPESALQLAYSSAANGPFTITSGSSVNTTSDVVTNTIANKNLYVVTATVLSDLVPIAYALPNTLRGVSTFNVIVDVVEINSVASSGAFTVRISRDSKVNLSLDPSLTILNGRPIQNSAWTLDNSSSSYYILRSTQSVPAGNRLSFGLSGTVNPGGTAGLLTISAVVLGDGLVEAKLTNNIDAEKVDYFRQ